MTVRPATMGSASGACAVAVGTGVRGRAGGPSGRGSGRGGMMPSMPKLPEVCRAVAEEALASLSPELQEIFQLRLARWWPDIKDGLLHLYSKADAQELGPRLVYLAACAYRDRDPGRISEAEVALGRHRFGGDDLDLPRAAARMKIERLGFGELHIAFGHAGGLRPKLPMTSPFASP